MKREIRSVIFLSVLLCILTVFAARAGCATPQSQDPQLPDSDPIFTVAPVEQDNPVSPTEASLPGPLRSFLRMAAISQKVTPDEVLPLLARNVVMSGYQQGRPTQFLVLLNWYMDQARELQALA